MSYILDALRKADAQRERDSSRGIHAHPTPLGASGSAGGARAPWLWGAAAVAIAAIVAGGWYLWPDKHGQAPAPVVATAAPAMPTAPVREQVAAPASAEPVVTAATAITPPPPAPPQPRESPPPRIEGGMLPVPRTQAQPPSQPPVAPTVAPAVAPAARAPAASDAATPTATGLPADAPRIAISGGVYSPSPAQRMLIVNGQVFNEGSEVAPGVTIAEIKSRTAVLKFRGARYTVAY
jgi:general secretion pathway protein B